MDYFAKIINDIVVDIIVADQNWIDEQPDKFFWVHYGSGPKDSKPIPTKKNTPAVGWYYYEEKNAFLPPRPFQSWVLNEKTFEWEAPVPIPKDAMRIGGTKEYMWNEKHKEWTPTGFGLNDNKELTRV